MRNTNKLIQEMQLCENIAGIIAYSIKTFGFWIDFADKEKVMRALEAGGAGRNVHFYDSMDVMSSYIDVLHDFVPVWEGVKVYSDKALTGARSNVFYALNKRYVLNWIFSNQNVASLGYKSFEEISNAVCKLDPSLPTRDCGD